MRLGSTYHFGKVIAKIHAGTELLYYQAPVDKANAPKPAKRSINFKETAPGEGAAKKAR